MEAEGAAEGVDDAPKEAEGDGLGDGEEPIDGLPVRELEKRHRLLVFVSEGVPEGVMNADVEA